MMTDIYYPEEFDGLLDQEPSAEQLAYPETEETRLTEAGVALEHLTSLYYTIAKEGVSRHDISSLHQVRDRLTEVGLPIQLGASLEAYSLGSFTASRSFVNCQISQEGIAQTVAQTIKAWIQALIDYLVKSIKWFFSIEHRDQVIAGKIDTILKRIEAAETAIAELTAKTTTPADLRPALLKFAAELLNSTDIKRNGLTAAAFGVREYENKVRQLHYDARAFVGEYKRTVLGLQALMLGKADRFNVDIDAVKHSLAQVKLMNVVANDLTVEQPAFDYVAQQVQVTAFEKPFTHEQRTYARYEFLVDTYRETTEVLRQIKGVKLDLEDPNTQNLISELVTALNNGLAEVEKLVTFFSNVNETHLRVLSLYYRYVNKRYTLTLETATETAMTDNQRLAIEKIHKRIEVLFARYKV